jgi:hypothetical protein
MDDIVKRYFGMEVRIRINRGDKYLCAEGIDHDIFTQGKNWDELILNIIEAVSCYFDDPVEDIVILAEFKASLINKTAY